MFLKYFSSYAAFRSDYHKINLKSVIEQNRGYLRSDDLYSRQNVPGAIPDLRPSLQTDQRTSLITGQICQIDRFLVFYLIFLVNNRILRSLWVDSCNDTQIRDGFS